MLFCSFLVCFAFSSVAIKSEITNQGKRWVDLSLHSGRKFWFCLVKSSFHGKQFTKWPNSSHSLHFVELLTFFYFFCFHICRDSCVHPICYEEPNHYRWVHSSGIFLWDADPDLTLSGLSCHLYGDNHWECNHHLCGETEPSSTEAHVLFLGKLVLPGDLVCLSNIAQAFVWVLVTEQDYLILQLYDPVILLYLPHVHWMRPPGCNGLWPLLGCLSSPALPSHHDPQVVLSAVNSFMDRRLFYFLGQGIFYFTPHILWPTSHKPLLLWHFSSLEPFVHWHVPCRNSGLCTGFVDPSGTSPDHYFLLLLYLVNHLEYAFNPGKEKSFFHLHIPFHCCHHLLFSHSLYVCQAQKDPSIQPQQDSVHLLCCIHSSAKPSNLLSQEQGSERGSEKEHSHKLLCTSLSA